MSTSSSNLLPASGEQFVDQKYWESFYAQRGARTFDWYGTWETLGQSLDSYLRPSDKILQIGCGSSPLADELHDNGYRNVLSIDNVADVITGQTKRNKEIRPDLKFECMDATKLTFDADSFNVVIDKGTVDALMPPDVTEQGKCMVEKMFDEVDRVLCPLGRYIVVTLAQRHVLQHWLQYFAKRSYMLRVQLASYGDEDSHSSGHPVYLFVATKMRAQPVPMPPVIQYVHRDMKAMRMDEVNSVLNQVLSDQEYCRLCYTCRYSKLRDNHGSITMYSDSNGRARYELRLIDDPVRATLNTYAVMLVPKGRFSECSWMYSTVAGNEMLRSQARFDRLALVSLCREQEYGDLDAIKLELNNFVLNFSPNAARNRNVPYLVVSDGVGERVERACVSSEYNDQVCVEDVKLDDTWYRRLIFKHNLNVIQSEVKLVPAQPQHNDAQSTAISKSKKSGRRKKPATASAVSNGGTVELVCDPSTLSCDHHAVMLTSLSLLQPTSSTCSLAACDARICLLGLGAGLLATFLIHHCKKVHLSAVEIDPVVVKLGGDWFRLPIEDRLDVHVADAVEYVHKQSATISKYSMIMCDLAGGEQSSGGQWAALSAPIQAVLTDSWMQDAGSLLTADGLLLINVITRDNDTRQRLHTYVKRFFTSIVAVDLMEDVNQVLVCSNQQLDVSTFNRRIDQQSDVLKSMGLEAELIDCMSAKCTHKSHYVKLSCVDS